MKNKKILDELPGKTIYESNIVGEVCHYFTDIYHCPLTQSALEIPGKGAFNHLISSFLFTKLNQAHIPTQYIRSLNMRENVMSEGCSLPFDIHLRCFSGKKMAQDFGISEQEVFNPPLIDYIYTNKNSCRHTLNEGFLLALDWATPEELEEINDLALYATRFLQGLFISFDLSLVEISLSISYGPNGSLAISGHLFPEFFCVFDLKTQEYLGMSQGEKHGPDLSSFNLQEHQKIADRLKIYSPTCSSPVSSFTSLYIV